VTDLVSIENAGECPRCHNFVIAEEFATHACRIRVRGSGTIWLDWIGDGFEDDNGDFVRMAKGLEGKLYSIILCKHNPPHSLESRLKQAIRSPEDGTEPGSGFCIVVVGQKGL
jgi:hypothetical protein